MFGLVFDYRSLSKKEKGIVSLSYCGLCENLRREFGELSVLLPSNEGNYLALLTSSQRDILPLLAETRCTVKGYLWKSKTLGDRTAARFAASASVLLLSEKLNDDIRDDKNKSSEFILNKIRPQTLKAEQILMELGLNSRVIEISRENQYLVESKKNLPLQDYLEPTANIVSEFFYQTGQIASNLDNLNSLRTIGRAVGRLVALADACEDLLKDHTSRTFNPIVATWGIDRQRYLTLDMFAKICLLTIKQLFEIRSTLSFLLLHHYPNIVNNALTKGVPLRAQLALTRLWRENHWGKGTQENIKLPPSVYDCPQCGLPHSFRRNMIGKSSKSPSDKNPAKSLWGISTLYPDLDSLAQELNYSDTQEYLLSLMIPLMTLTYEVFYGYKERWCPNRLIGIK